MVGRRARELRVRGATIERWVFFFEWISRLTQTWCEGESGCVVVIAWLCSECDDERAEVYSFLEDFDFHFFPVFFDELPPPDPLPDVVERDGCGVVGGAVVSVENGPACVERERVDTEWVICRPGFVAMFALHIMLAEQRQAPPPTTCLFCFLFSPLPDGLESVVPERDGLGCVAGL